ncbi:putative demethylsterigmatocystin 6-O-methyltransferase [Microsporum canis]|uniref:OmtB n=1 Tax=Arthroderma otae (strain ATCC MYA-4605 / CBS 113480) TaxID=554155 RepID=C5FPM6_ARTOC|nr:OmtB [Microsporum canis CBS 113480]EEQ31631.1 OmtB [Microsporum canis CBS 113480]
MEQATSQTNGDEAVVREATRMNMQEALRAEADATETPSDLMVRMFNLHLEIAVVRIGCDLGFFKLLAAAEAPLRVENLARSAGADPQLCGRLLRYLASVRLVAETSKDYYAANNSTRALADPKIHDSMYYVFNTAGPVFQALPEFLRGTKYAKTADGKYAWHKGFNTELDFFPWVKQHPEHLQAFQSLMSVPREGDWLSVAPFTELTSGGPEQVIFVDVGGSIGHQSVRLRARFPDLPGRIIVQDLEETIKAAPPAPGVEFMVHNFFNPQPIKGKLRAKFYYLRTVLHDWEDSKAVDILRNIIPAMSADSLILIDDMALPNTGVHRGPASLDLHMLMMLGALERNLDQWNSLLEQAGLKVVDIRPYHPVMRHSIIIAAKK